MQNNKKLSDIVDFFFFFFFKYLHNFAQMQKQSTATLVAQYFQSRQGKSFVIILILSLILEKILFCVVWNVTGTI